ncbi:Cerberus [Balearica regulorum gibbericeps]|uniref:Cerberus n=1 Tax=Balearica regulorum gibbericeps TaxID=100784 RepID=A0A087VRZ2_BALRE|nr:PREDICTED: cerberus-like [Balearica regulorum gibbericeps]KFO15384.1 Cerberus [Balearica regulorum gibbericeps]
MSLLLLQLLMLSCLAATEPQGDSPQRKSGRPFQHLFYQDKNLLETQSFRKLVGENLVGVEETPGEPSFFVAIPQTAPESEKQEEKKMSRFILPNAQLHADKDLRTWAAPREISHVENFSPSHYSSKRQSEPSYRKDAKKFWDHFMLKKNSASEEVVLPIKTNEMHQENCRTLPFSQGVTHESCEKVMVQNNLCFGKCSSFHVPGPEDHLYTFCSHCLPSKFSMKRLNLNCTSSVPVVKEVMIVEECKCETQRIKNPVIGSLLSDLHTNVHEHN